MTCESVVGVTRFELVTSSVSGKRSPPELNAHVSVPANQRGHILCEPLGECKRDFEIPSLRLISCEPRGQGVRCL